MDEFKFKTAIPTASDSKGLLANNGVYFSSSTHLFKLSNNKYQLVSSCNGTIQCFGVYENYTILCTQDKVYFNHFQNLIGSLNRSASAVAVFGDFFALGVDNILEVWLIPREYKFTLFTLHSKNVGHYKKIVSIVIISSTHIATASEDCTVRLFDIAKKESKIIGSLNDIPIGLHYDDINDTVIATCRNGSLVAIKLGCLEYKNAKFDASIVASSMYGDLLAICLENMVLAPKEEPLLPTPHQTISKREVSKKSVIIIFKNMEEIYRGEIEHKVLELCLEKGSIFMKTSTFLGKYDIQTESFRFTLSLPKITTISLFKNMIAAGCLDGNTRIYREAACIKTLYDPNAKGAISATHISANVCTVLYKTGYVSVFNINDSHCFRSFSVSNELSGVFSSSSVSEDNCFLFISEKSNVKVIDLVKSRLLDTVSLKSPIISIKFYRNYLYTIELDKILSKINVFSGHSENVALEEIPTNLAVKEQTVLVSTVGGIVIYDLDLNFISSSSVRLEGRKRNEMYSIAKAVEQVDIAANSIFCGGSSNLVKVFGYNNSAGKSGPSLMKTIQFQILKVSRNKDWENYKTKLMKEKEGKFEKEKVIETLGLCADVNKLYLLSTEGLSIYEKRLLQLTSIEFDVEASEGYLNNALSNKQYQKGLIAAIRMKNFSHMKKVIDSCSDIDFLVRYLPVPHAKYLLECLVEYVKQDFTKLHLIDMIVKLVHWHGVSYPGLLELLRDGTKTIYKEVKSNKYLIDEILKRKAVKTNEG